MEIAAYLANTPEREQQLFATLDTFAKSDDYSSSYNQERAAHIKLFVFDWHRNKKAIEPFLQANLKLDAIRKIVIEKRLKEKRFAEVRQLCEKGIRLAKIRGNPGTVEDYQKVLLGLDKRSK